MLELPFARLSVPAGRFFVVSRMTQEATAEDVERIKDVALKFRQLALTLEPADILFALAVVTAGHICTEYPKSIWGDLAVGQLKLTIKMINEYPTDASTPADIPPPRQN
jgi:hypothetical protein